MFLAPCSIFSSTKVMTQEIKARTFFFRIAPICRRVTEILGKKLPTKSVLGMIAPLHIQTGTALGYPMMPPGSRKLGREGSFRACANALATQPAQEESLIDQVSDSTFARCQLRHLEWHLPKEEVKELTQPCPFTGISKILNPVILFV